MCPLSTFLLFPHCLLLQLFQACGNIREGGTSSTVDESMKRGKVTVEDKLGTSSNKMEKLVSIYPTESHVLVIVL